MVDLDAAFVEFEADTSVVFGYDRLGTGLAAAAAVGQCFAAYTEATFAASVLTPPAVVVVTNGCLLQV